MIQLCRADTEKVNWAFKLYDVDNDGMIDINEISVIMQTLDSIEGVLPGATVRVNLAKSGGLHKISSFGNFERSRGKDLKSMTFFMQVRG